MKTVYYKAGKHGFYRSDNPAITSRNPSIIRMFIMVITIMAIIMDDITKHF